MFPHTIDSTIMAAFRSCPQKAFRTYVQHWKPQSESVHLVAGGAFAKGIEAARKAFYEGEVQNPVVSYGPNEDHPDAEHGERKVKWEVLHSTAAIGDRANAEAVGVNALLAAYGDFECPPESAKSLDRTAGALAFYFDQYPLGADGTSPILLPNGKRGIEFSFAHALDVKHPVTGMPLLYTGRSDMIAEFAHGTYIFDEKTTSQLGATWPRQWEMRSQFTGYAWAAKQDGIKTDGSIVRGVSILKSKYDTLQAITYRGDWEIERWYEQLMRDLKRMVQCWEDGWWDYNMDSGCAEYGGCSLLQVCKSKSPDAFLDTYFEQRVWDPLARKQVTVPEWEASWDHKPVIEIAKA
jgi:hypothetical protein